MQFKPPDIKPPDIKPPDIDFISKFAAGLSKDTNKKSKEKNDHESKKKSAKKKADKYIKTGEKEHYISELFQYLEKDGVKTGKYNPEKLYTQMIYNHYYLLDIKKYKDLEDSGNISDKAAKILLTMLKEYFKKIKADEEAKNVLKSIENIWSDNNKDTHPIYLVMRNINLLLENIKKGSKVLALNSVSYSYKKVDSGIVVLLDNSSTVLKKYSGEEDSAHKELKELLKDFVRLNNIVIKDEFDSI